MTSILGAPSGHALEAASHAQCRAILNQARGDSRVYVCLSCSNNVLRLAERMRDRLPGFDLARARVIYFLSPDRSYVRSFGSWLGSFPWNFHVVLEHDGMVMDLDLPTDSGLMPMADYVRAMFLYPDQETESLYRRTGVSYASARELMDALRVRFIPAAEYLREYPKHGYEYYTNPREPRYPVQAALTALKLAPPVLPAHSPASAWSAELDAKLLASPEITVEEDGTELRWGYEGITYRMDVRKGTFPLKTSTGEPVRAPEKIRLFLRKIELTLGTNDELRQALSDAREERRRKNSLR